MEKPSFKGVRPVTPHILVVCSGGGHWIQMKRLLPAFDGLKVTAATVDLSCLNGVNYRFESKIEIPDFNRKDPVLVFKFLFRAFRIIKTLRPTHVISTGAAPGIVMLAAARLRGAKVLWVDSIANTKKLSMSGRIACFFAHHVFTQWPHLDKRHGAKYSGRVI